MKLSTKDIEVILRALSTCINRYIKSAIQEPNNDKAKLYDQRADEYKAVFTKVNDFKKSIENKSKA